MPHRLLLLLAATLTAACSTPPRFGVALRVVDEAGAPLPDATADVGDTLYEAGADGLIHLRALDRPVLAVVRAPGRIAEPVPVGRDDAGPPVDVPLLDDKGGTRRVVHTAGDVMLGRRYLTPTTGAPLVVTGDGGASALDVVSDIAPAFAEADLRIVNLETVVGDFPAEAAYPKKRFLLQTPPEGLAALAGMATDIASLANNHQRDWLDLGVASTLDALDAEGLTRLGAGVDAAGAAAPARGTVDGFDVAVFAYTSVDGDYVNDQYPLDGATPPDALLPEEEWQWEARAWGAPAHGIADASRRIGGAWQAYADAEPLLDDTDRAAVWASLVSVYPEMQDWVARRGHGGANHWDTDRATAEIAAAADADLVIVELHMGFQFAAAPGVAVRAAAYAAIDAGADLVVAHHPHVLQGVEWYRGRLVAWSLGNFLFDQDFLSTFRSAFLRTVWEADGTLVQARIVPVFLDRYRPLPTTGSLARDTLRLLWEASLVEGSSERGVDLAVRTVAAAPAEGVRPASFRLVHDTAVLSEGLGTSSPLPLQVPAVGEVAIDAPLVRRRLSEAAPAGIEVGRSVFRVGSFEDEETDAVAGDTVGWAWESDDVRLTTRAAPNGVAALEFVRGPNDAERVSARTLARGLLVSHRLHADQEGVTPLDGAATWSLRLRAWLSGESDVAALRVAYYHFYDLDPTEDPESTFVREVEYPLHAAPGGWRDVSIDLAAADVAPSADGLVPNAVLLYVGLSPPRMRTTVLRVDDVELIEWRAATDEPEGWGAIDWLRATDGAPHTLAVDSLTW